jgi:hypothetical protein
MTQKPDRWEQELDGLLAEIEHRLKNPEVAVSLGERGVNTSIALVATQGLRAYVRGNKAEAAEDLATAADELDARLQFARRKSEPAS